MENSLQRLDEHLRVSLTCAEDLLWEWDLRTGELKWDTKVQEKLGEAPGSIEQWLDLIHPADRERVVLMHENAQAKPGRHQVHCRIRHRTGIWRHWLARGRTISDDAGRPLWLVGACVDITEQKQAREALDLNEAKLWDVLENTHDCIWEVNERGRFTFANRQMLHSLGYRHGDILGKTPARLMLPGEWRELLQSLRHFLRARLPFTGIEHSVTRPDGGRVVFSTSGSPIFDREGDYYGIRGVSRNITDWKRSTEALQQSEQRYRQLIEEATDAVFALDTTARIEALNSAFQEITGWPVSEWVGKPFKDIVHPADLPPAIGFFREVLAGASVPPFELRIRSAQGHWLTGEFSLWPHREEGRVVEILGIGRDISDRKEVETRWARIQKMESIGRLAGGVAHDFNNLLTIIKGFAELLHDDVTTPDGKHKLDEVLNSTERAIKLTRQLLAFSRRQPLQPVIFDLNQTIRGMETILAAVLSAQVKLRLKLPKRAARVAADPNQIEQVIMNLIINARDAMPDGGELRVAVKSKRITAQEASRSNLQPGTYVSLSVQDTGCGMSPDVMAHLFEPFFTTKAFGKGTGLGLATVYGIVKQSGGHIEVASTVGEGSTFNILLPKARERRARKEPAVVVPKGLPKGKETILLVEDEPAVRHLAQVILSRMGHQVIEAENSLQALELAASEETAIDLLLTDMVMAKMSGRDLADKLRAAKPGLKVILMSGYSEGKLETPGGKAGDPYNFIQKPFTATALAEHVRNVLNKTD